MLPNLLGEATTEALVEETVFLGKRKGFIYQSSEFCAASVLLGLRPAAMAHCAAAQDRQHRLDSVRQMPKPPSQTIFTEP
jgi:hypothetical protein